MHNENDKENLTEYDLAILECEDDYDVKLPQRYSYTYLSIENFQDYEYTNNLAYEMVRRNEEFKELTKKIFPEKSKDWSLEILKLGLDPRINIFQNESDIILDQGKNKRFFYESPLSHIINDIYDGLNKLIVYYFDKNQISVLVNDNDKYNLDSYEKVSDVALEEILQSPHNYYIPCLFNLIKRDVRDKKMQQLCNEIPLRILEKDFLNTLKQSDTKYKYTQLMPRYSKPELVFSQSDIVNIPINLNLQDEEIIAYISKAKEEYNKQILTTVHPLELLGKKLDLAMEPKSAKKLPKDREKRKVAMADAFYVYDLYKILEPIFKTKQEEFRKKKESDIKKIKQSQEYDKDQKNSEIIQIKKDCKYAIIKYNKLLLEYKVSTISNLSVDKVQIYYTLMKEYIDNLKYKDLIIGSQHWKTRF